MGLSKFGVGTGFGGCDNTKPGSRNLSIHACFSSESMISCRGHWSHRTTDSPGTPRAQQRAPRQARLPDAGPATAPGRCRERPDTRRAVVRADPTASGQCPRRSTRSSTQSTATPTTLSMGVPAPTSVLDQSYERYARSRRQAEGQREVLKRQIGHFSGGVMPHIGRGRLDRVKRRAGIRSGCGGSRRVGAANGTCRRPARRTSGHPVHRRR